MDGASTGSASNGLARHADGEIGLARLAEIRRGKRVAELVALGGGTCDISRVLMPELVARGSKARGRAVDDAHCPGVDHGSDIFQWNANGQIGLRTFAEIRC